MNEWENEPNSWEGEMMAMRRGPHGAWCGYVAVPPQHPLFGVDYNEAVTVGPEIVEREIYIDKVGAINLFCADPEQVRRGQLDLVLCIDVHGGLTYASNSVPGKEPDGNWWFGFDCAHAGDIMPKYPCDWDSEAVYRNFEYVKSEVLSLAKQLARWPIRSAA